RVEIFNILGSKVLSFQIDPMNELNRFDVSDLRKGVYMVRIYDGHNNVLMTKTISKR
ncbi:MAG: T9SS C-terminal target domain-containing protein, partial [Chloroflexi bacterium]